MKGSVGGQRWELGAYRTEVTSPEIGIKSFHKIANLIVHYRLHSWCGCNFHLGSFCFCFSISRPVVASQIIYF